MCPPAETTEARAVLKALEADKGMVADRIVAATVEAIPQYADYEHELRQTIPITLQEYVNASLAGTVVVSNSHLENARRRAAQGFDGNSLSRVWRIINRHLWFWLTNDCNVRFEFGSTGIGLWNTFMDITDTYVEGVLHEFYATLQLRAFDELASRQRAFEKLLVDELDPLQTAEELQSLGVHAARIQLLVCEPRPEDSGESLLESMVDRFELRSNRLPWLQTDTELVMCLPVGRELDAVRDKAAAGTEDAYIGLSATHDRRASLPDLLAQARWAVNAARLHHRVVEYAELTLVERVAARIVLRDHEIPPQVLKLMTSLSQHPGWFETIHALMDSGGNTKKAAERLHVHQNTLYYRLSTLQQETGYDLRDPRILADLYLAASSGYQQT